MNASQTQYDSTVNRAAPNRSQDVATDDSRTHQRTHDMVHSSREIIREHAATATMLAFGIGVGAGLAIASLLANDSRRATAWRSQDGWSDMADRISRNVVDSVRSWMPGNH
ncbi:MAG: hypothetical protein KatS3mg111_3785 [Pirellulaceae bacterium]|nr:MAG: hypothetical protein KatS3mg111_3785 [Pirellulaceae bacterium]